MLCFLFFLNDTATPEIYPLSLHAALPIWCPAEGVEQRAPLAHRPREVGHPQLDVVQVPDLGGQYSPGRSPPLSGASGDRKSTRLNSSHANISYAVFCLKKKKQNKVHAYNI